MKDEFCLMSTPNLQLCNLHSCRLGVDIIQNSSFIYLSHDHTTQEKEFLQAVYSCATDQLSTTFIIINMDKLSGWDSLIPGAQLSTACCMVYCDGKLDGPWAGEKAMVGGESV